MKGKDYALIANSIVEWHDSIEGLSYNTFTSLISGISKELEDDNDEFDNGKFTRHIIEKIQQ